MITEDERSSVALGTLGKDGGSGKGQRVGSEWSRQVDPSALPAVSSGGAGQDEAYQAAMLGRAFQAPEPV